MSQKKASPAVSCRKLVDIIKNDFGLEVSKSSVNAVIKEFSLSSPVGRRPVYKAPKNFLIPPEKKEQLLQNVTPFLSHVHEGSGEDRGVLAIAPQNMPGASFEGPPDPVFAQTPDDSVADNDAESGKEGAARGTADTSGEDIAFSSLGGLTDRREPQEDEAPDPDGVPVREVHLLEDPLARTGLSESRRVEIELSRAPSASEVAEGSVWGHEKGRLYQNAGLLLAASFLWNMQRRPVLGEILAGDLRIPVGFDQLAGIELFSMYQDLLGEDPSAQADEGARILFDHFFLEKAASRELADDLRRIKEDPAVRMAVTSHLETVGTYAAGVCIEMNNGRVLYFDALFQSFADDFSRCQKHLVPLLSATERVGDMFISNVCPLVVRQLPGSLSDKVSGNFFELVSGKAHISQISILDEEGRKCAVFRDIPKISRRFIVQASLSTGEFSQVDIDTIGNSEGYFDFFSDNMVSFFEGKLWIPLVEISLRVFLIGERSARSERAVLSNIPDDVYKIFYQYASYGNSFIVGNDIEKSQKNDINMGFVTQKDEEKDICAPLPGGTISLEMSLKKAFRQIFRENNKTPVADLFTLLLKTPGFYKSTHRGHFIRMLPSSEISVPAVWDAIVFLMNQMAIMSYDGKRVHFSLEKP